MLLVIISVIGDNNPNEESATKCEILVVGRQDRLRYPWRNADDNVEMEEIAKNAIDGFVFVEKAVVRNNVALWKRIALPCSLLGYTTKRGSAKKKCFVDV